MFLKSSRKTKILQPNNLRIAKSLTLLSLSPRLLNLTSVQTSKQTIWTSKQKQKSGHLKRQIHHLHNQKDGTYKQPHKLA